MHLCTFVYHDIIRSHDHYKFDLLTYGVANQMTKNCATGKGQSTPGKECADWETRCRNERDTLGRAPALIHRTGIL